MRTACVGIVVLVGVVAAGCGGAARQASPTAARQPVATAFTKRNATQAAGAPVLAARKTGVSVRPLPGGTFGLLLVLENRTHRQLMLQDVRAVVPHGSFVRQVGTHLAPFFQCHPYCPRHAVMRGPFGNERPVAFHVHPLRSAQARLDFAVAGCGALRTASAQPITRAVLIYTDTRGTTFRQTIALDSARIGLRSSGRTACRA